MPDTGRGSRRHHGTCAVDTHPVHVSGEWVDARVHQTGFTTTFPPNTKVPYTNGGVAYDIDFNSSREGAS